MKKKRYVEIDLAQKQEMNGLSSEKPMFPISIVADILKVHQRTLRIYDDKNILIPSRSLKMKCSPKSGQFFKVA